MLIHRY